MVQGFLPFLNLMEGGAAAALRREGPVNFSCRAQQEHDKKCTFGVWLLSWLLCSL